LHQLLVDAGSPLGVRRFKFGLGGLHANAAVEAEFKHYLRIVRVLFSFRQKMRREHSVFTTLELGRSDLPGFFDGLLLKGELSAVADRVEHLGLVADRDEGPMFLKGDVQAEHC